MTSATSPSDSVTDDDYQPIRALNDLLFCERRCALHRIEQIWVDNRHTVEGTHGHRKVHDVSDHQVGGDREVRGMWLRSDRLRIVGVADLVEFRPNPYPVEYKRGRRRKWDNDDVQLCAQALCLEEMLGVEIPAGAVFHLKSKRRREVPFDETLRHKTEQTVRRLHELLAAGVTPPAVLKPRCSGCSLHDLCLPELAEAQAQSADYLRSLYEIPPVCSSRS